MSNLPIELLLKKKNELEAHRDTEFHRITMEISGIEAAIEQLTGKKVWEIEPQIFYDDTNPDYIKASIEEI